jgi:beta-lactamase superfamily II metal-dependent hydrolase
MINRIYFILLLSLNFFVCFASDEVVFYNVGEGHCALAYKQGKDPLLIDAGSRKNIRVERNLEEFEHPLGKKGQHVVNSLTTKINEYWKNVRVHNLNIILTHPDNDHIGYLPHILTKLGSLCPTFKCNILMGGREEDYDSIFRSSLIPYLNSTHPKLVYSANFQGLKQGEQLGYLQSSGCITHLFCPRGGSETNSWSIVTRLEFNQEPQKFSVLITGDADTGVQNAHLNALGSEADKELKSHVFLYPHHGGQPLSQNWIKSIDPEVVIVSAGRFEGNSSHPKANAIDSIFWQGTLAETRPPAVSIAHLTSRMGSLRLDTNNRAERIWQHVDPHKFIYYGNRTDYESIRSKLPVTRFNRFEFVDDTWYTGFGMNETNSWRCALTTIPLYNLFASGTLVIQPDSAQGRLYRVNLIDVPSETDIMMRWIYDSVIDGRNRGIFADFHQLSHRTKRLVHEFLRNQTNSVKEAEYIFFLCFNVIPNVEESTERISAYREAKLLAHLKYVQDRVKRLIFFNDDDCSFFRLTEDLLFAKGRSILGVKDLDNFADRCFVFDAFYASSDLLNRNERIDLLFLYYMIYSILENLRPQMTTEGLQTLAETFNDIPTFDEQRDICTKIKEIYDSEAFEDLKDCHDENDWEGLARSLCHLSDHQRQAISRFINYLSSNFKGGPVDMVDALKKRIDDLCLIKNFDDVESLSESAFEMWEDLDDQIKALYLIIEGKIQNLSKREIMHNIRLI